MTTQYMKFSYCLTIRYSASSFPNYQLILYCEIESVYS